MSDITLIREKAEEYIRWDPVKSTREEIQKLLTEEKWDELCDLVLNRLTFGTAGSPWLLGEICRFERKNGSWLLPDE